MTLSAFISLIIGSPFEGALLLVLFEISGALEQSVVYRTRSALNTLHKLVPKTANLIHSDGKILEKSIKEVAIGDHLLIKAGEVIPLDGKIIKGSSNVNLVHLTGEALPISKTVGDTIPAGALNMEGSLVIEVTKEGSDSTLARIISLITQAQKTKPKIERFTQKFGKYYSSLIILSTGFFALIFPLFLHIPFLGITGSIYRSLTFMIAASPCALIIAIPTAYLSALSSAARKGILLKGGITFDALATCKTIAFDKTGTLTKAELECKSIFPLFQEESKISLDMILCIAASLEKNSTHPIANAICRYAATKNCVSVPIQNFTSIPGYGVSATIIYENKQMQAFLGLPSYVMEKLSKDRQQILQNKLLEESNQGKITTLFFLDDSYFLFTFEDMVREGVKEMILALKKNYNMEPFLLTGDIEPNANLIGKEVQITQIHANLRPQDKLALVSSLSEEKGLAMVGDGINDAPALAKATVGISMGKIGSSTAIDASDVILLHDQISQLSWLFAKSNKTLFIVKQNLIFALSIIAFASIPALLGFLPLWSAVFLHEGGTLLVCLNSLRLLSDKI